uniref:Ninein-like n=1 Tax=Fundulus heteroclitus TaxID=8078 RepID=A0A3Q2P6L5_FUNHE
MEGAEPSGYLAQLKAEFERCCGAGATGQLDRAGLTALSGTLQLDHHLPLLLDTLLGAAPSAKVNFEDFKDGLVAVLSGSLDLGASEDDSSYLQPAVPQEVQPKLVRGAKRYGRRSRPEPPTHTGPTCDPEDAANRTGAADPSPPGVRRAKLRRSTSLESVESLKSDEEAGSAKMDPPLLQNKDQQQEDGGGPGVLAAGCDHLVVQDGDELLRGQEADLEPGVTVREFRKALWSSAPMLSSTPVRPADLQRAPLRNQQLKEEGPARSAPPSLLTATVGQRLLGRLDDGSGFTSPERVAALWTEEGISNSWEILQTLDFGPEERLGLAELTLALDNELLAGGNGIHQAALVSYRNQIQHLQEQAEQAGRERDKLRADLDRAEQRNLQLVREADERHACMETLSESRVRELEQDFRERLASLRCRAEQDGEALLQQAEQERLALQEELQQVRAREARLQEELAGAVQERRRVEEELDGLQEELKEAQSSGRRLQADLDQLLLHKLGSLDPSGAALSHEERFSELLAEYERQRRELQDRNDELELLRSCRSCRRSPRPAGGAELSWSQQQPDSDDPDMRSSSSPAVRKRLQPADGAALSSLDVSGPSVSIQTELALQQLKQNQEMELQQLQVQLETQTNYYERQLELMRRNMEVERKDICQAFKLEISELEEQKAEAEQQVKQLKEAVLRLQNQVQQGGGARSAEEERRMQREQAELEQNYAREMGNLVRRLSAEKEQQEAELKLQMDQEVARVRTQLEEVRSENAALQERLKVLQQQVQNLEDEAQKRRRRLQEVEREHQRSREEEERLHTENCRYREEVLDLSSRNLQLSGANGDLSSRLRGEEASVATLRDRLATVARQREEDAAAVRRLQEELRASQLGSQSRLEAELSGLNRKLQEVEEQKEELQRDAESRRHQVERLQQQNGALQAEAELLRAQLLAATQERLGHAQEGAELRRKLQEALSKVEEQEQLQQNLQQENRRLRDQNQELQQQLSELQVQDVQVQNLRQQLQNLRSRLEEEQKARTQAQDQALRSDGALGVLKERQEEVRRSQEEVRRSQQQEQQSRSLLRIKQEQWEQQAAALQRRVEELEVQLKALRSVLQDRVQQLKQQMERGVQTSGALKELYLENGQLLAALQVTEQRQKRAENKNLQLEEKVGALNELLRQVVATVLAT